MKSFRIRLTIYFCLVSLSTAFTATRPLAIHRNWDCGSILNTRRPSFLLLQPEDNRNDASSSTDFDPEVRRIMGSLATLGVLETSFLTYTKLANPSLDICGTAGDCASVLNGPYSTIPFTNIPLATLGLVAYLTTAYLALEPVVLSERDDSNETNRLALLATTTAMGTFSVYLLSLIYGILHTSCLYCLASAILSISLASCAWLGGCFPRGNHHGAKRGVQAGMASFAATTLTALLLLFATSVPNKDANMSSALLASTPTTNVQQQQQQQQQEQLLRSPPPITTESSQRALVLSQDLQALNAKMYGAYWCSHCYDQKQSLGKGAFDNIQYYECAPEGKDSKRDVCQERDVPGYPTWEINGKLYPGERDLEELEDIVKQESH